MSDENKATEVIENEAGTLKFRPDEYLINAITSIDEFDPNQRVLTLFLGKDEDAQKAAYDTGLIYINRNIALQEGRKNDYRVLSNEFKNLKEQFFPDTTEEELGAYLTLYFQFIKRYMNRTYERTPEVLEKGNFINRIRTFIKQQEGSIGLIQPILPKSTKGLGLADQMRRAHLAQGMGDPDTFSVYLANSYILLRVRRPKRKDLFRLLNEIVQKLKFYGERYSVPSISLEKAGISRILVDFVLKHLVSHSVKGVIDEYELKKYILLNDLDTIAVELLKAGSPKGVQYLLNCIVKKCNFSGTVSLDPANLLLLNDEDMTNEQKDVMYKMLNEGLKLSPEELATYQNKYLFNQEKIEQTIYMYRFGDESENPAPYGELKIEVPSLATAFTSFDLAAERNDPEVKELATNYPDKREFRQKRAEYLGTVRITDYVHWISEFRIYGDPNTDSPEDKVYTRNENHREFDDGLIDIFNNDDDLYGSTLAKVLTVPPKMTHVFCGILNSECPNCQGHADDELKHGVLEAHSGFTAIDPIINFFDHTRIQISTLGEIQAIEEDILS